ncbi:MAG: sodium-dependent transporter [Saprospiraceae bacterium]|nr:sodium-dependent transporter [Saprospiraceae bacterium]
MTPKHWTSRLTFILTTASFAIGLGNIWRFPYLVGENGGGIFLLIYLALVFLVGIPILLTEVSLGRMAQSSPLSGFGLLSGKRGWNMIGWLEVVAALLIMGFYIMILAWVAVYGWESMIGALPDNAYEEHFTASTRRFFPIFLIGAALTAAAGYIVTKDLKDGIEQMAKWLMPLMLILILMLGGWAISLNGAAEGIRWYLYADLGEVSWNSVLAAMGQLFFSIGVGFTTAFVFGSYSRNDEDIVGSTGAVVIADTLVAFLAGFMIFPALFAFQMTPDSGPGLVFVTMAQLFSQMPMGRLFGTLFFLLLIIAGFTSLAATVESVSESLKSRYELSAHTAIGMVVGIIILLSVPNILSYGDGFFSQLGHRTFFEWTDFLTNSLLLPLIGLLIVLFTAFVLGFRHFQHATNQGAALFRVTGFWKVLLQLLIPLAILSILINNFL